MRFVVRLKFKPVFLKRAFIFLIVAAVSFSCGKTYPLKDVDPDKIAVIRSVKSPVLAWDDIIAVFTANGFSIKESNKEKGVIISDKYDFSKHFSFVKNGKPMDSTAWMALSYVRLRGGFGNNPIRVTAEWKVSVLPDGTGSIIKINLSHVDATVHIPGKGSMHPDCDYTFTGISTGVFEGMMRLVVK